MANLQTATYFSPMVLWKMNYQILMIWYGDNNTKVYSVANVFIIIILLPHPGHVCRFHCTAILYGYGFQTVYSGIGHINQGVGVKSRLGKPGITTQKYKKSNRFCFGWTVVVTSVVSGKQLL